MSRLSTHVLDTALGRPAGGMTVHLQYAAPSGQWEWLNTCKTDADGRCANLLSQNTDPVLQPGQYRLRFETGNYHAAQMVVHRPLRRDRIVVDDSRHDRLMLWERYRRAPRHE